MNDQIPEGWPMLCPMCNREHRVEDCNPELAQIVDGGTAEVLTCPDCAALVIKQSEKTVKDRIEAAKAGV